MSSLLENLSNGQRFIQGLESGRMMLKMGPTNFAVFTSSVLRTPSSASLLSILPNQHCRRNHQVCLNSRLTKPKKAPMALLAALEENDLLHIMGIVVPAILAVPAAAWAGYKLGEESVKWWERTRSTLIPRETALGSA